MDIRDCILLFFINDFFFTRNVLRVLVVVTFFVNFLAKRSRSFFALVKRRWRFCFLESNLRNGHVVLHKCPRLRCHISNWLYACVVGRCLLKNR